MTKNYPQKLPRYLVTLLPSHLVTSLLRYLAAFLLFLLSPTPATATPTISNISAPSSVAKYEKFEITFDVNTTANNPQLPFLPSEDTNPYTEKLKEVGISVDALFLPPGQSDWQNAYRQPAFYYQHFNETTNPNYKYPLDQYSWKVRFSPNQVGSNWQFQLQAVDKTGSSTSPAQSFSVANSDHKGFIRVSPTDPRYFEYEDGTLFYPLGYNIAMGGLSNNSTLQTMQNNNINFVRAWLAPFNIHGTAWTAWQMMPTRYGGYLPRVPILPLEDSPSEPLKFMYYLAEGNDWYQACAFLGHTQDKPAVKRNTTYHIKAIYKGRSITGPRRTDVSNNYGFVVKIGGWAGHCRDPYNSSSPDNHPSWSETLAVTNHGTSGEWSTIQGTWNSGNNDFIPFLYMVMENANSGSGVYISSIEMYEMTGGNAQSPQLAGANILDKPSPDEHLYFTQRASLKMDQIVDKISDYGIYVRPVINEKEEYVFFKLDEYGNPTFQDDPNRFYGSDRNIYYTRWIQQAWWRYIQARWGYSPYIHSWELINEGNPANSNHFAITDELGKFMRCRVFGISIGSNEKCLYNHPNWHMATTSFWHSFPANSFWKNGNFPNVDHANVHAYISTSTDIDYSLLDCNRIRMQKDAAAYHHCHSTQYGGWNIGKPIIRGEAGMDIPTSQDQNALGIQQDTLGVWFHNYMWSQLNHGAMIELYWWTNHIFSSNYDHRPEFNRFRSFIQNIPFNNSHYQDAQATSSNTNLRITGQKDNKGRQYATQAHLWIQNKFHRWAYVNAFNSPRHISFGMRSRQGTHNNTHTFRNPESDHDIVITSISVTDNQTNFSNHQAGDNCTGMTLKKTNGDVEPKSCTFQVVFSPSQEGYNFDGQIRLTYHRVSESGNNRIIDILLSAGVTGFEQSATITIPGFAPNTSYPVEWWNTWTGQVSSTQNLTTNSQGVLSLTVTNLEKDTAVKIGDYSNTSPPEIPYSQLIQDFGSTTGSPADLNNDGIVNIFDFNLWISQPQ